MAPESYLRFLSNEKIKIQLDLIMRSYLSIVILLSMMEKCPSLFIALLN